MRAMTTISNSITGKIESYEAANPSTTPKRNPRTGFYTSDSEMDAEGTPTIAIRRGPIPRGDNFQIRIVDRSYIYSMRPQ
jgi:hypothetical protein